MSFRHVIVDSTTSTNAVIGNLTDAISITNATGCKKSEGSSIHVVGTILSLIIIIENVIVLLALTIERRRFKNILFVFINSLAASDLLSGIVFLYTFLLNDLLSLPFTATAPSWVFRKSFLIASLLVSLGSLQLIALDRFVSVAWPLEHEKFISRRRAVLLVTLNWMFGAALIIAPVAGWNCVQHCVCETATLDGSPNCPHPSCSRVFPPITNDYIITCVVIFFMVTLGIVMCNAGVFWKVRSHFARMAHTIKSSRAKREEKNLAVFMVLVFIVFILCWMPAVVLLCIDSSMPNVRISDDLFDICSFPALLNSIINPWLYAIKLKSCRTVIVQMLCSCVKKEKRDRIFKINNSIPSVVASNNRSRAVQKPSIVVTGTTCTTDSPKCGVISNMCVNNMELKPLQENVGTQNIDSVRSSYCSDTG
uniref:G-protein coupled receptors family 1 profile domain-containing protein n=1 Tax=Ciona savignyi TaxID=51511 RepID=H2ZJR7_CIOSA